ncbi:putative Myb-like HTH transcriptional regulator family protein [Hibiscus syriacus]|uniref:Myb-like HTH transcriptional regulator family protein n=1 Tax=Hibiscus syriacus TaxID=106335 RepID=A0A6A2YJR6_HIBSY|nr:putative Myb-like HTH transcriptional regulator family protein [Hibiscus syriacus]
MDVPSQALPFGEALPPGGSGGGDHSNSKPLNPAKEWLPESNCAPEEDRCLFITFSNGKPIPGPQIVRFFTLKYGDWSDRVETKFIVDGRRLCSKKFDITKTRASNCTFKKDNFDPTWIKTAERPWDPPLIDNGLARAFKAGRILRTLLPFRIHRVFVSPFFRCVQTASEVVAALCAVDVDAGGKSSKDVIKLDLSRVKYGLCEMLNSETIRVDVAPKDGIFRFDVPQLESMLPSGTLDPSVERVYKELPQWEETVEGCRSRYAQAIKALADKYPSENLLLVTHGKGRSWSFGFGVLGAHDLGRSRVLCVFGIKKIDLKQKRVHHRWEL